MGVIRKIGLVLLVLLTLLVAAILVLQAVVNPNDYKEFIRQQAAQEHIDLTMKGDIHWSFFPAPAFTMEDIDAVLPVGDERQALRIAKLKIALAIAPLLDRKIEFSSVEIKDANAKNLNNIHLLIEDLNSSGRSFPMKLSLVFAQDTLQVPIQLKTAVSVNLADKQSIRVVLDPFEITVDNSHITGIIHWQQGAPDHTELNLKSDSLLVRHLTLTDVQLSATVDGKKIMLQSLQANAYQGQLHSNGAIDLADEKAARLQLNTELKGVQLAPFLADLQQKPSKILAGSLQLESRLTALPLSRPGILKTLSGDVQFSVNGLVINEVNLEKRVCEAVAQLESKSLPAKRWPPKTEFREMHGTATIRNGVMVFAPLAAKLDTLNLVGAGPVSLPDNVMDLRLELKTMAGQQAVNTCAVMNPRLSEISWPLRCEGNYVTENGEDLCSIDKSRMDKIILQVTKEKVQSQLDGKGESLKGMLEGLLH
ncbi:MAG TPA: AsmA family protein [Pseudomonadales bacterium]|nr:AsmA family protein [Pseudomonadales bacterium]